MIAIALCIGIIWQSLSQWERGPQQRSITWYPSDLHCGAFATWSVSGLRDRAVIVQEAYRLLSRGVSVRSITVYSRKLKQVGRCLAAAKSLLRSRWRLVLQHPIRSSQQEQDRLSFDLLAAPVDRACPRTRTRTGSALVADIAAKGHSTVAGAGRSLQTTAAAYN